jgi:hypothetical protein
MPPDGVSGPPGYFDEKLKLGATRVSEELISIRQLFRSMESCLGSNKESQRMDDKMMEPRLSQLRLPAQMAPVERTQVRSSQAVAIDEQVVPAMPMTPEGQLQFYFWCKTNPDACRSYLYGRDKGS